MFVLSWNALLGRVVLLVTQITLQRIGFDHLHVLQYQGSTVLLGVLSVVLLALSQGFVSDSQLVGSYPLFSHHGFSGLMDLGEFLIVNVVERHQFWPLVLCVVVHT